MGEFYGEFEPPYRWAAEYRKLGLQVVPGRAGDKRPIGEWGEFQNALVPEAQFLRWFDAVTGEHRMQTALGVITGRCSRCGLSPEETSGLFLLDLDGERGRAWWLAFVETHLNGLEPESWMARSGGGGLHRYFLWPADKIPKTYKRPDLGVDGRGQGGYAVLPPSIHPNGKAYEWVEGFEPWTLERPAMAPPELVAAIEEMAGQSGEHGGERAPAPVAAYSAAGLLIDGREDKMLRAVWGAVVDLHRECPIPPPEGTQRAEFERVWAHYEQTTKSRLEPRPGVSNSELLDLEEPQRGRAEMARKWAYAMRHWDTKVAEAAKVPKPAAEPVVASTPVDSTLEFAGVPGSGTPVRRVQDFEGDPPEQEWLVNGWIPKGKVTLFGGAGGSGKSLAMFILAHCVALGTPWLGLEVEQGSSLYVSCEDDSDELRRRAKAIRHGLGYPIGNPFEELRWLDRTEGLDNRLAMLDQRGGLTPGPFLDELRTHILATRPTLLILDTVADFFGGEENNRVQVNMFVKTFLGGLIREARRAGFSLTIVLLGHPSKAAALDGSGYSGSTAWENAVRSRLMLEKPKDGHADERRLTRPKANYAGAEDEGLRLMWESGILHTFAAVAAIEQLVSHVVSRVESAFAAKRLYHVGKNGSRYLFRALVDELRAEGHATETVIQAINRAIEDGLIVESTASRWRGWRTPKKGWGSDD